jgi:hypothetical protein
MFSQKTLLITRVSSGFGRALAVTQFDAIDGVVAEIEAAIGPIDGHIG